ncbi:nuclear transport factor 2 family protein [Arenibacter algicola]|uniref:nuclear transport factor 2 family protein n=1 Tax=Arenibacter algicola TaxID=616991 RepID=UPI001C07C46D|nr:nuclear transport factor 2 family protein [Arenibacter algicola]MBU2904905.1 nuclear transport factor 2 family protein [Arenibacter algicola]
MSLDNLKNLTKKYIQAFDNKDINSIKALLTEDFILEDPVVKKVRGRDNALKKILEIFNGAEVLSFKAISVFQQDNTTLIEFNLILDDVTLKGVDILDWENNKIKELRAYLDIPK